MKKSIILLMIAIGMIIGSGCSTSYKAKPLPFKSPDAFPNSVVVSDARIGARAFTDRAEAKRVFGFDVIGAGMLPVQVVFDNQGAHALEINGQQTFLQDAQGNLWPILDRNMAYERATKYAKTKQIFKNGAYKGFLGAAAGTLIGAAIGIVSGEDVAASAGKGAAVGAAAGATVGGVGGYADNEAHRSITNDLRAKSLQSKAIEPKGLAHGFLFFPGEAETAKQLRLQIKNIDTNQTHIVNMAF